MFVSALPNAGYRTYLGLFDLRQPCFVTPSSLQPSLAHVLAMVISEFGMLAHFHWSARNIKCTIGDTYSGSYARYEVVKKADRRASRSHAVAIEGVCYHFEKLKGSLKACL